MHAIKNMTQKNYGKISRVIPKDLVRKIRARTLETLAEIRADYFPGMDDETFYGEYRQSLPSKLSRAVAYRAITRELTDELVPYLRLAASAWWGAAEYTLFPVFYVRVSSPSNAGSHLLDSQPHYDRTFNAHAYTFWIPLEDVDRESGGICLFPDPELENIFIDHDEAKNRYDYEGYKKNHAAIDPLIQGRFEFYDLEPGDVVTFDSNVLHGATRPISRRRLSLDVRLIQIEEQDDNNSILRLLSLFQEYHDASNALNLYELGDGIGAKRILVKKGIQERLPNSMMDALNVFSSQSGFSSRKLLEASPWHAEYSWFNKQNS